jgi:sporulation protein YlmC with PRC-barrel domain
MAARFDETQNVTDSILEVQELNMSVASKQAKGPYTIVAKRSLLGSKVVNGEGKDLGTVEDLVIDSRDDRVVYAILSFGGFLGMGDKNFAIPWQALGFDVDNKVAVLNIDQDRLKNAPGFDKDNWPDMTDRTWASQIHTHYGYTPYWESDRSEQRLPPRR